MIGGAVERATAPPVSVVVVSHGRPDSLCLCLTALFQLYYANFEIVVVADAASRRGIDGHEGLRVVPFEEPNISRARNLGLAMSGGEIIAFIDDDAVPEPTWLDYLVRPVAEGRADLSGGFVRGRNGISFQWCGYRVFPDGRREDLPVEAETVFPADFGAIKTEGTNMAIRREVLVALGGFNEAYKFYLDETDLNLRAAQAGYRTALCPLAQVHHGYSESDYRRKDRAPRSLFEIGASAAVFEREHGGKLIVAEKRQEQRKRLLGFLVAGYIEPHQVATLLATFDEGAVVGATRPSKFATALDCAEFSPVPPRDGDHVMLSGHWITILGTIKRARRLVREGHRVSVFLFSLGTRFHRVRFVRSGYWLQHGGMLGKSDRTDSFLRFITVAKRAEREMQRVFLLRRKCTKG